MKLGRVAILALALASAPLAALALGSSGPEVELATPGVGDGAIERFTVRFTQPMVPLGNPQAASPFEVDCKAAGQGRWVDQQTFVHEFTSPLPGGVTCKFALKARLKSLAGYEVSGQREFSVDSGGPIARAVLPGAFGSEIEEDQVFLVAANLDADPQSVGANAYCAVDGLGEKIPVDVLPRDVMTKLMADLGTGDWNVRNFLQEAGLPQTLPARAEDRAKALASITALKCRRPLPPGRDMALVWGKGVKSGSGRLAGADQRFDYSVRKPFTARFECSRTNAQAGCSPVEEAWVRFSAPIARAQAEAIRIQTADGKQIAPKLRDEDKRAATIAEVRFPAPLPTAQTAKLVLPAGIKDESGRVLSNGERFPLDVRFDEAPPLVKFAAPFGIIELKEGGVLPVTVRNVEGVLAGADKAIPGEQLKLGKTDGEVAQWLRTVAEAQREKSDEVKHGKQTVTINQTGATPILPHNGAGKFQVSPPGKGKDFEVVGIPLTPARLLCRRAGQPAARRGAARAQGAALCGDRRAGHQPLGPFQMGPRALARLGHVARYRQAGRRRAGAGDR